MKYVLAVAVGVMVLLPGVAYADGVIEWTGNGSDNLPCADGGHWVLAPAFGIESATLTVNGTDYVMTQNGNGSWSADSVGALDDQTTASVTYTGDGDERDHLQLSHCIEASPSPTPSPSESPSETPSQTPSESTTPSVKVATHTPSKDQPSPLAQTGGNVTIPLVAFGGLLALAGAASWIARRKSA